MNRLIGCFCTSTLANKQLISILLVGLSIIQYTHFILNDNMTRLVGEENLGGKELPPSESSMIGTRNQSFLPFFVGFIVLPFILFSLTTEVDRNAQELEFDIHEDSIVIWPIFLFGVFIYGFILKKKLISYGVASFFLFAVLGYILGFWEFRWSWGAPTAIIFPHF